MKSWKIQKFFADIVYDLRSRGLLPVVILLVIAMVAVPILITRGGGSSTSGSLQPTAATAKTPPEAERAVVSYAPPGLRDYKKRLDGLTAKNPFDQPSAPAAAAASQLNSTVTTPTVTGSSTSSSPPSASTSPSASTGNGSVSGSSGSGGSTVHRYFYYSVADLSVGDASQPLQRHKHLQPFSPLPDQVAPVMIYLGSSLDGKRAYFSISRSAGQLMGPGTCVPSPTDCSLLVLGRGQVEDVVYSLDGKTYRVKINKINRVVSKGTPSG
jgi:hypothetical protein